MENLLKPLAKIVLIQLGLTAAASVPYAAIHKMKISGSGSRPLDLPSCFSDLGSRVTTSIISNEEVSYIIKTVKSLE